MLFLILFAVLSSSISLAEAPSEQVIVAAPRLSLEPGSKTTLSSEELAVHKYTDLNRVLKSVPGVQIQEEDGFGLRPNIGMRGAHPHRSRKVLIMEDGIPSGPAPYAAPAAYYVPDMSLMDGIEVTKGPAAVRYGPQTIGGAIDMTTRALPEEPLNAQGDLALGSYGFKKAILSIGGKVDRWSWLVLGSDLGSEGFKKLDGGGKTGFHKRNLLAKTSYAINAEHSLRLKLSWSDEFSPETYLGLSATDFANDPYRRYAASARDNMQTEHKGYLLQHRWTAAGDSSQISLYQNTFARTWTRLNGFANPALSIRSVLLNPIGQNDHLFAVLTGADDSLASDDRLIVANNDRSFYSRGLSWEARKNWQLSSEHSNRLEWGLRLHEDGIERHHTTDSFEMLSGRMVSTGAPRQQATQNRYDAKALAAYVWNTYQWSSWSLSTGVRQEWIQVELDDKCPNNTDASNKRSAMMPSMGVFQQATPSFGWFLGVYRGIGLALADDEGGGKPEESINYETGLRWNPGQTSLDTVAFWNDYRNIKGTCSASEGCSNQDRDLSVDGGKAKVYGLEVNASHTALWADAVWPLAVQYTYTQAQFANSFNSVLEDWGVGIIQKGDPLPYIPRDQLNLKAGVKLYPFQVHLQGRYQSASPDQALANNRQTVPASRMLDMMASYTTGLQQEIYLNMENVLKTRQMVSYRPFGLRPGKPFTIILGTKISL